PAQEQRYARESATTRQRATAREACLEHRSDLREKRWMKVRWLAGLAPCGRSRAVEVLTSTGRGQRRRGPSWGGLLGAAAGDCHVAHVFESEVRGCDPVSVRHAANRLRQRAARIGDAVQGGHAQARDQGQRRAADAKAPAPRTGRLEAESAIEEQ